MPHIPPRGWPVVFPCLFSLRNKKCYWGLWVFICWYGNIFMIFKLKSSVRYLLSMAALLVSLRNLNFFSLSFRLSSTSHTTRELDCKSVARQIPVKLCPSVQIQWTCLQARNRNKEGYPNLYPPRMGALNFHRTILTYWGQEMFLHQYARSWFPVRKIKGDGRLVLQGLSKRNIYTHIHTPNTRAYERRFSKSGKYQQKSQIFRAVASVSPTIFRGSFSDFVSSGWRRLSETVCDRPDSYSQAVMWFS